MANRYDRLFWLAVLPWLISLVFGITGFVTMSLPWAIPIGLAFSLLWLRNLTAARGDLHEFPQAVDQLGRSFSVWCAVVLVVSPLFGCLQAREGTKIYYLPRHEAASVLLTQWHTRHPGLRLRWVGGEWAENAALAFYADASIQVVPGVPDQFPATVSPLADWSQQAGLLLCPLGSVEHTAVTDCPQKMQAWLQSRGQSTEAFRITVYKEGLLFPMHIPFVYVAFDYLPVKP
jgi:hypothetical protein